MQHQHRISKGRRCGFSACGCLSRQGGKQHQKRLKAAKNRRVWEILPQIADERSSSTSTFYLFFFSQITEFCLFHHRDVKMTICVFWDELFVGITYMHPELPGHSLWSLKRYHGTHPGNQKAARSPYQPPADQHCSM